MQINFHPESDNYKFWTIEEDKKLEELTSSNKISYENIGKILNRTGSSCQCRAKRIGINNKFNLISNKKYTVDENFFTIPNELNSYWAGFSSADGSIIECKNKNFRYKLEISQQDQQHINQLVKDCNFTGQIRKFTRKSQILNNKNISISNKTSINVNSNQWALDLKNNFNVVPNKTYRLAPPNLSDDRLLLCWLIGYTDGDGTIFYDEKYTKNVVIGYVSSSEHIMNWIKDFTDRLFPLKIRKKATAIVTKNKKFNCWHFRISGIRALVMIDYLRKFNCPKMERKWSQPKILELIESQKQKYPNLFLV